MSAPQPNILERDLEILMDAFAFIFSTDERTSNIHWILGDVGMGGPTHLPFGYIAVVTETVGWYTGSGGLAAGGPRGLDDWGINIQLTVAFEPHRYIKPQPASLPDSSPYAPANNQGFVPLYQEQPGWRKALQINQQIKKVLRTNPTVGGAATDTRVVESRWILIEIDEKLYRAARTAVMTQQRRVRGD